MPVSRRHLRPGALVRVLLEVRGGVEWVDAEVLARPHKLTAEWRWGDSTELHFWLVRVRIGTAELDVAVERVQRRN